MWTGERKANDQNLAPLAGDFKEATFATSHNMCGSAIFLNGHSLEIFPFEYDGKIFVAGGGVHSGHSGSDVVEVFSR
jgi:hypothetical protein